MRARGRDLDRKATELVPPHVAEVGPGRGSSSPGAAPEGRATALARAAPARARRASRRPAPDRGARHRLRPHSRAARRAHRSASPRRGAPCRAHGEGCRRARARRGTRDRSTAGASSWPSAASTPTAIARSSPEPPLRRPDGARLTVIRFSGHPRPLDMTALRTRSRDSRQAASGNPTMVKPGSPLDTWTSTLTARPSTPRRVAAGTVASTVTSLMCDMRTPQLHLRMTGEGNEGDSGDHTRGVGHSPSRKFPEDPPL